MKELNLILLICNQYAYPHATHISLFFLFLVNFFCNIFLVNFLFFIIFCCWALININLLFSRNCCRSINLQMQFSSLSLIVLILERVIYNKWYAIKKNKRKNTGICYNSNVNYTIYVTSNFKKQLLKENFWNINHITCLIY